MAWPLKRLILDTENLSAGLYVFKTNVIEFAADISNCMSLCYRITTALQVLDNSCGHAIYERVRWDVKKDLDLVFPSLKFTIDTCRDAFAITPPAYLGAPAAGHYYLVWLNLQSNLMREGNNLVARLELYSRFIEDIVRTHRGYEHPSPDMGRDRSRLLRLLERQEGQPEYMEEPLPFTPPPQPVHRGPISFSHVPAPAPYPPLVPEPPPLSPTYSNSSSQSFSTTQTYGTGSGSLISEPRHWAQKIFDGKHQVSPLPVEYDPTRCCGTPEPNALQHIRSRGYFKALELSFEQSAAKVLLFWRPSDYRVRVVFEAQEYGRWQYCTIPSTALMLRRYDSTASSLTLARINKDDGKYDKWANLNFTCFERLVLFYCIFVTMKKHDPVGYSPLLDDFLLGGEAGEKLIWSGTIRDDTRRLRLQMFRDRVSGCVRIEVTPYQSVMGDCPIWTAFLNQYIHDRRWIQRRDNAVYLSKLHPYIFHDTFKLRYTSRGLVELKFTQPADAMGFVEVWEAVRLGRL